MKQNFYKIYCDGGSRGNPGPSACAFVVYENEKIVFESSNFLGRATNNFAEYMAVFFALEWLLKNLPGGSPLVIEFFLDSELVSKQLSGVYKVKKENLREIFLKIKEIEKYFQNRVFYKAIPREENQLADSLVNIELDSQ